MTVLCFSEKPVRKAGIKSLRHILQKPLDRKPNLCYNYHRCESSKTEYARVAESADAHV